MEAHTEGRAPTSKLRRGRGAEGLGRRGEGCRGRKADVSGRRVESTEWWIAHRRSAHGEGKHATGAQGGHNTFLIFEKVLRVFQDIQHGIEIEIPIPFGPLGPPNKPKSRSHGEWREGRRGGRCYSLESLASECLAGGVSFTDFGSAGTLISGWLDSYLPDNVSGAGYVFC